jgi:hypothetical protein
MTLVSADTSAELKNITPDRFAKRHFAKPPERRWLQCRTAEKKIQIENDLEKILTYNIVFYTWICQNVRITTKP